MSDNKPYRYVTGHDPARDDELCRRVQALNRSNLPDGEDTTLEIYVLGNNDSLIGGLVGRTEWGWLHVSAIWVDEPHRHRGIATELLRRAEGEARSRGCTAARLNSWDFQAPDLYRRLGYNEYARLDDYPPGHTDHYFRKSLVENVARPSHEFVELPVLQTPRLILRRLRESDAADVFAYASDPAVAEHTSWQPHASLEESRGFAARMARSRGCAWGIEHRADAKIIGTCGFQPGIVPNVRGEIGYALSRTYWGQGLMTEAVRELLRFGFQTLGLNRIEARAKVENVASCRVMEKTGMTLEGTLREVTLNKGRYLTLRVYSILRREWEASQSAN